jgi:2-polyprenyl-3-methyl-5-hydroxy-6-metoxy-1,4-benzoquinol methylase
MDNLRYPQKYSSYSSHSYVSSYIRYVFQKRPPSAEPVRILDFGCGTGNLFEAIADLKVTYLGVEPFTEDSKIARSKGLDILEMSAEEAVANLSRSFDVLIFADVLEHLVDPFSVLSNSKNLIPKDGQVVISCPNVAHFVNRIGLLLGKWNYQDRGILDRTHLRFYTVDTLSQLIRDAGFEVLNLKFSSIPFESLGLGNKKWLRLLEVFYRIFVHLRPSLFGYQIIVLAKVQE